MDSVISRFRDFNQSYIFGSGSYKQHHANYNSVFNIAVYYLIIQDDPKLLRFDSLHQCPEVFNKTNGPEADISASRCLMLIGRIQQRGTKIQKPWNTTWGV